jgi:hypothetical protein
MLKKLLLIAMAATITTWGASLTVSVRDTSGEMLSSGTVILIRLPTPVTFVVAGRTKFDFDKSTERILSDRAHR